MEQSAASSTCVFIFTVFSMFTCTVKKLDLLLKQAVQNTDPYVARSSWTFNTLTNET